MEHTLDYKTPPKYATYKKRHEEKLTGSKCISESEFNEISNMNCFYCGVSGPNGIDRINATLGYEKSNCAPCCKHCNYVKGNLSLEDFETWANRFVKHQLKKAKRDLA